MTTPTATGNPDRLTDIGLWVLGADTRWFFVVVLALIAIFCVFVYFYGKHKEWPSRGDAINLFLATLQVYSAAVIVSMLFLTEPPAIHLVGKFERQSAGMLAAIFLLFGVFIEFRKVWVRHKKGAPEIKPGTTQLGTGDPKHKAKS